LVNDINHRQEENNKQIAKKRVQLESGNGKAKKLNREIAALENANNELEATRGEIATLKASAQTYDLKISDEYSENGTTPGSGKDAAATRFNRKNGNVEIVLYNGASLGRFAHELKHTYQFEIGEISLGPKIPGDQYPNFLHDKFDESAGFKRGYLFGDALPYGADELPEGYNELQRGPVDAKTHPNVSALMKESMEVQRQNFQRIADVTRHAFRVNGVTYYKKESQ
jgi:hypothetical protein